MPEAILRADGLGIANDGTAAVSGGAAINCLGVAGIGTNRQAIRLTNHGAVPIWFKYVVNSDAAPAISATSKNGVVNADGGFEIIQVGRAIRVFVISSDAAVTSAFTAVELI